LTVTWLDSDKSRKSIANQQFVNQHGHKYFLKQIVGYHKYTPF
jgi:hypothetical protein